MSTHRFVPNDLMECLYQVKNKAEKLLSVLRRADRFAMLGPILESDLNREFDYAWEELGSAIVAADSKTFVDTINEEYKKFEASKRKILTRKLDLED
jgi:hypothetical protein